MSERSFVEKPFLEQLAALGWHIVDQGQGVPTVVFLDKREVA